MLKRTSAVVHTTCPLATGNAVESRQLLLQTTRLRLNSWGRAGVGVTDLCQAAPFHPCCQCQGRSTEGTEEVPGTETSREGRGGSREEATGRIWSQVSLRRTVAHAAVQHPTFLLETAIIQQLGRGKKRRQFEEASSVETISAFTAP